MKDCYTKIPLTKGLFAMVDNKDAKLVNCMKWQARYSKGNHYAIHSTVDGEITMHSLLLGNRIGYEIDHKNHDGLDNRRSNLRYATLSQNRINVPLRRDNHSGYKGVSFNKAVNKWKAYIQKDKVNYHIGYFETAYQAAVAYNNKAIKLFGEFAWQNEIL